MVCAAGTTSIPSGLARLDATLATYLVAATPIEQVSPVSDCTRSRIVHAISAGLPCRRRAPDTSRNASSIDSGSTSGVICSKMPMTCLEYFE